LTRGNAGHVKPDLWDRPAPQPELLLGVGVGLLTAGARMAILFLFGRRTVEANRVESAPRPR